VYYRSNTDCGQRTHMTTPRWRRHPTLSFTLPPWMTQTITTPHHHHSDQRRPEWRGPSPSLTPPYSTPAPDWPTSPATSRPFPTCTASRAPWPTTTKTKRRTASISAPRRASVSRRRSSTTRCRRSVRSSRRCVLLRSNFPLRPPSAASKLPPPPLFSRLLKYTRHTVLITLVTY